MAGETSRFRFLTFDSVDDTLDARGYKFTDADRVFLDQLLTYAVDRHHHDGHAPAYPAATMADAPYLTVSSAGGIIPPNTAVYYRYVMVDSYGRDYISSQTAVAFTPPPVTVPARPSLATIGGTLRPGDYVYAVSAYTNDTTSETPVSQPVSILLPAAGGIEVTLPPPPSGATGFNIYRKGPMEQELRYRASVFISDMTFNDISLGSATTLRGAPTANTTFATNSITVAPDPDIDGNLPNNGSWKVYRTYSPQNWDASFLSWTINAPITDTGHATATGAPQMASGAVQSPTKIDLETEVTGILPANNITVSKLTNFTSEGTVTVGPGTVMYVNEYEHMRLVSLRACLGRDSMPTAQDVHVGLEYLHPSLGWTQLLGTSAYSVIAVGETVGTVLSLTADTTVYGPGDAFRAVVNQAGGGATPTDRDLALTVNMAVHDGTATWPIGGP